jgi:uncharacterized cupin superfamily protein
LASTEQASGVVIDRGGVTWTDTRDMEWGQFVGLGSAKVKILHADQEGVPLVFLVWMPPGDLGVEIPHRHYHATTHEWSYIVEGDLPHWEYASAESDESELVVFRPGYYMDRSPGSIHGLEEGVNSDTGTTILFWRDNTGNWLDEPRAAEETLGVPFADAGALKRKQRTDALSARYGDGTVLERDDLRIVDSREMAWEPHDGIPGSKIKVLSRFPDGQAQTSVLWLPPGDLPKLDLPHRHYHATAHEFIYVLEGEVVIWEYADADQQEGDLIKARPGFFMNRAKGSLHGIEAGYSSPTGSILLEWRTAPGTYLSEPEAAGETFSVPYA